MRPPHWHPSVELSPAEQTIISRIKKAKLFIFLRHNKGLDQRLVERTVEIAFDLRRVAVVHNLHVIARIKQSAVDLQASC